jgi:3-dehydroquinate synthase
VNLAENSYTIVIGSGMLSSLGKCCADIGLGSRVAIITNPTVNAIYGVIVRCSLAEAGFAITMIEIPDGEEYKNIATLSGVYDALIEAGLDRKSFIVALGGGVVGDLAGFAAATYMRGIPFVQVPTSLLAQVDSSVGGKTAIDHPRGKNLIGAFFQPRLVVIDVGTISTLPDREYRAGLAEVVKYGIAIDLPFFDSLEQHAEEIIAKDLGCLETVIRRCCEIKAHVVELDEKESGLRAVLNYGHTLGHAFETVAGYRELVHGEAVALGMVLAARVSANLGHCSDADVERVSALIKRFGMRTLPPETKRANLLDAIVTDKKSRNGTISFICNQGIGNFAIEQLLPEKLLTLSELEVFMKNNDSSAWSEIKSLDDRLSKEPDSFCFSKLSELYLSVGLVADALHTARQGVAKHPDYLDGQRALAMACNASGLYGECRTILEKVTAAMPADIAAQKLLAGLLLEAGDKASAIKVYTTVLDFRPDDAQIKTQLEELQHTDAGLLKVVSPSEPHASDEKADEDIEVAVYELSADDIIQDENDAFDKDVMPAVVQSVAGPHISGHHDPLSTLTLAELYEQQGFIAKSLEIYRTILADDSGNIQLKAKIAALECQQSTSQNTEVHASTRDFENDQKTFVSASLGGDVLAPLTSSSFVHQAADNVVGTLDRWLENIRRIKACR